MPANLENSAVATGLEKVSFHSNPKERQCQRMTSLGSILKIKEITLPTNVCLVKAVVFPVVMYGCESWTLKKAEHQRIEAFVL